MKSQKTRLDQFKEVCHKWLVINNDEYIDVIFGVLFANQLDSKPVWLHIVGPPGSGKTEILQTFSGSDKVYPISSFTKHTLVSGKIRKRGEKDPSLALKIDGKILIVKDFTTILTMRSEDRLEIFGQLREFYDGSFRKGFGTGEEDKIYYSHFGIITGVTNEIDNHLGALSSLGERFLIYRCPNISEKERFERAKKASRNVSVKQQEKELMLAAHRVLAIQPQKPILPLDIESKIQRIVMFLSRARTNVKRNPYTREPLYIPEPEIPTRLMKQLTDLAIGIAMARKKEFVTEDEIKIIKKVAIDCIHINRLSLLDKLTFYYPEKTTPKDLAKDLNWKPSTIKIWLDDLKILEIVSEHENKDYKRGGPELKCKWRLKLKYARLLKKVFGYEKNRKKKGD